MLKLKTRLSLPLLTLKTFFSKFKGYLNKKIPVDLQDKEQKEVIKLNFVGKPSQLIILIFLDILTITYK